MALQVAAFQLVVTVPTLCWHTEMEQNHSQGRILNCATLTGQNVHGDKALLPPLPAPRWSWHDIGKVHVKYTYRYPFIMQPSTLFNLI